MMSDAHIKRTLVSTEMEISACGFLNKNLSALNDIMSPFSAEVIFCYFGMRRWDTLIVKGVCVCVCVEEGG